MAYRFQFRGDTENNWQGTILADREIGILKKNDGTNTNLYKIGDGKTKWEDLPYYGFNGTISNNLEIVENEQADKSVLSKLVAVNKFNDIIQQANNINDSLTSAINDIEKIIGDPGDNDIYTELNSIKETDKNIYTELNSIKDTVGSKAEGDKDIYTELNNIKGTIGTRGDNEDIYTELNGLSERLDNMMPSVVLSSTQYDSMIEGGNMHPNTLYFVYD